MRSHGWGGDVPVDDDAASARILSAARRILREHPGSAPTIAQVAERLSVTRQTVYRYFPSTNALLVASVSDGVAQFLADITDHLRAETEPAEAVIAGIAYTYEQVALRSDLSLLMAASGSSPLDVTSQTALELGRSILDATPVDWPAVGYDAARLDRLVEHMLRMLQSFLVDPGTPPRTADELRAYLREWVGPAVSARVLVT